jgi:hypothetical protein
MKNRNRSNESRVRSVATGSQPVLNQYASSNPALARKHFHLAYLALKEAEALAWETGFPALFFPELAEEKLNQLRHWESRQRSVPKNLWETAFAE